MHTIDRRGFLKGTLLTAAALAVPPAAAEAAGPAETPPASDLIDTNVYLFRWPFRRLQEGGPEALVAALRRQGVTQAWAGSFEGLFHKDLEAVNRRLAEACRRQGAGMLVPFGGVNPLLPGWEEDLRRIAEEHRMPGIRLHPGYHGYGLDAPAFARVLEAAAARDLVVQVVPWMEDERHHNRLMPVPTPDLRPLAALAKRLPALRLVVLNGFRAGQGEEFLRLAEADNILFDFAKLDVITPLEGYLEHLPVERIVFGSFAPMFHFEAAVLKMKESGLTAAQEQAIRSTNARRVLRAA